MQVSIIRSCSANALGVGHTDLVAKNQATKLQEQGRDLAKNDLSTSDFSEGLKCSSTPLLRVRESGHREVNWRIRQLCWAVCFTDRVWCEAPVMYIYFHQEGVSSLGRTFESCASGKVLD